MKDARVTIFRTTLAGLIESLDATVHVTRSGADAAEAPVKESAAQLVARLSTAGRLTAANFSGSVADVARVNAMISSMRRLDAAYVAYRQQLERRPGDRNTAASALAAELDAVKSVFTWTA